jgi:hypothetical protein
MASTNKPIQDLFVKHHYDMDNMRRKSSAWFNQQVALMAGKRITPNKILQNDLSSLATKVMPGNLYLYYYDPKTKDTLPYYDRFPMVFPWKANKDGFIGLNMHYLPYQLRVKLMDNLLVFRNNEKMDQTTKLRYSWQLIDGMAKFGLAKPCVKQYLYSHVQSPFVRVEANDWGTAMMMPVERFVKAGKDQVWLDSRRKI